MAGSRQLEARGYQRGIQINGRARLYLDAELHDGGRQIFSVENPPAAVVDGGDQTGLEAVALGIAEALDIKWLHEFAGCPVLCF